MGMVIAIFVGIIWCWAIFEIPGPTIVITIIVFAVATCVGTTELTETETEAKTEIEIVKTTEPVATEPDSVQEQCIDGILYYLVIKEGEKFFGAKENRYGDNERCFE